MSWLVDLWNKVFGKKKKDPVLVEDTPSVPVLPEVPKTPEVDPVIPSIPEPPKPAPEPLKPPEVPEVPPSMEKPEESLPVKPNELTEAKILHWTKVAIEISQSFEGSIPWANPTGNFDGTGLTMGALGWTILYGDQQEIVKKFVSKYGEKELFKLMPGKGLDYWGLVNLPPARGVALADKWKTGTQGSSVQEPYRTELVRFWTDKRMIELQIEKARKDMGTYAVEQGLRFCKMAGVPELNFEIFSFYFDVRVLNGGMTKNGVEVTYRTAYEAHNGNWKKCIQDVLDYAEHVPLTVYSVKSMRLNGKYWKEVTFKRQIPDWKLALLYMGYQRAKLSKPKFVADVLCRRGVLALGEGYVHEGFYKLEKFYQMAEEI